MKIASLSLALVLTVAFGMQPSLASKDNVEDSKQPQWMSWINQQSQSIKQGFSNGSAELERQTQHLKVMSQDKSASTEPKEQAGGKKIEIASGLKKVQQDVTDLGKTTGSGITTVQKEAQSAKEQFGTYFHEGKGAWDGIYASSMNASTYVLARLNNLWQWIEQQAHQGQAAVKK